MAVVRRVVVIGGGVSGLAAARVLAASGDVHVTLLEGSAAIGGKLQVSDVAGLAVDEGAEQLLVRGAAGEAALALLAAVGLDGRLVRPAASGAAVWTRGALRPLPSDTVLGVPTGLASVLRSGVLRPAGVARASLDAVLPRGRDAEQNDVAVGRLVAARLGRDVVDRLVDPLLGGVYAGRADDLSMAATMPALWAQVQRHRTLLGAARAARQAAAPGAGGHDAAPDPVFVSLRGGLGQLPAAMTRAVDRLHVRTASTVRAVTRAGATWRVVVGETRTPEVLEADAVVLAVPARPAARLLADVAPVAGSAVGAIDYASMAIVTLAYRSSDVPPLRGTGYLVPAVDGRTTKAVTFTSAKWAHLAGPTTVIRASVGRFAEEHALHRDDADLAAVVAAELAAAAGVHGGPVATRVTRWGGGLPQYRPGHLDHVARARAALPPRLAVCGAAYDGVGVPACLASGADAARSILHDLRQSRGGSADDPTEGP